MSKWKIKAMNLKQNIVGLSSFSWGCGLSAVCEEIEIARGATLGDFYEILVKKF